MSEWKEYKLGEICSKIGSGATPKGGKEAYLGGDTSLIRSQNVLDFSFSWDGLAYINDEQAAKLNGVEIEKGDVLLNITGDSVARACIVPQSALPARVNQHVSIIRGDATLVLNEYILYFLQYKKPYLLSLSKAGATRNALTKGMIEDFSIPLPPLAKQAQIVGILSSLDDKIAVNKKICENLEAQAQALFKHWFVDFAPFKDGKFVESELGMIPLSIICEQITDGVHNSVKDEPNSSYMLLSCKNIVGGVLSKNNYRSISKNTFDSLRLRTKLAKGDILISSVGTIGEIAIVEEDPLNYEFQRSVAIVKPKEKIGTYFLYNALLASKTRLQHAAHGAVQQCLFLGDLKKFKVNCYDIEKAFLYNETVKPLFEEIAKLHQESDRLSTLRDTLLPKLMSGQIKVNEIEKSL